MQLIKARREAGATLIELLIAITVAVIIISALGVTTIVSLRNSQFSQNQSQATKLSQQGLDVVRQLRNRNGEVQSTAIPILNSFSDLWNVQMEGCNYTDGNCSNLNFKGYFKASRSGSEDRLIRSIDLNSAAEPIGIFKRFILIEDEVANYNTQKKVTVIVRWSDTSGRHESNLQTILTKQ